MADEINIVKMKSPTTLSYSIQCALHFVGIWPGTPCPALRKFLWVTFLSLLQVSQYRYIITYFRTVSLEDMIDTLSLAAAFGLTYTKLILCWKNHHILRYILSTIVEDCRKYAEIDTNNFIPKVGHLSFRLTTVILFSYLMSGILYGLGFLFQQTNNTSLPRELLLKADFPFDTSESPIYELVVVAEFLLQLASCFTYGTFSALLLMVVLHVGSQVDIMCQTLSNISSESKKKIRFYISRHQEIIELTQKIEDFFTYIALTQLISNTLNTCCLGFLMVVSIGSENGLPIFIKSCLFYIVVCCEVFIYCFAGEYLNIKSEQIGHTAYESLWYNLDPKESKLLILLIVRSQKGFVLTFGKFSSLSLECFTGIMKASASYVSMLLAMT